MVFRLICDIIRHSLLQLQVDKRDPNDPSPYLFAPWVFYEEGNIMVIYTYALCTRLLIFFCSSYFDEIVTRY